VFVAKFLFLLLGAALRVTLIAILLLAQNRHRANSHAAIAAGAGKINVDDEGTNTFA